MLAEGYRTAGPISASGLAENARRYLLMSIAIRLLAVVLIVAVLWDCFEAMVLPRRVTRRYRPARLFYRLGWLTWQSLALRTRTGARRHHFLSIFGPLSILALFSTWIVCLIFGFALLHWSLGTPLQPLGSEASLTNYMYVSGETFFTLGYGDLTATSRLGRALCVLEAGVGFGFMAIVIGYLPVLYQAFSQRELTISLMDARASSPPTAAQLLVRLSQCGGAESLNPLLIEWEQWAALVLESHLSFPVLSYYRSQHDNQSWLSTLTTILDTCALLMTRVGGASNYQVQLTFAMARHTAVDLALNFKTPPLPLERDRLDAAQQARLVELLKGVGVEVTTDVEGERSLAELRQMYEPFVNALAHFFRFDLPHIVAPQPTADNWQSSAWQRRTPGIGSLVPGGPIGEHFT